MLLSNNSTLINLYNRIPIINYNNLFYKVVRSSTFLSYKSADHQLSRWFSVSNYGGMSHSFRIVICNEKFNCK